MRFASNSPVAFTVEFSTIEHIELVAALQDNPIRTGAARSLSSSRGAYEPFYGDLCWAMVVFLWLSFCGRLSMVVYGCLWLSFYGGLNSKKANDDYTYKKKLIAIWSAIKAR